MSFQLYDYLRHKFPTLEVFFTSIYYRKRIIWHNKAFMCTKEGYIHKKWVYEVGFSDEGKHEYDILRKECFKKMGWKE